jgi:hypothetical protein
MIVDILGKFPCPEMGKKKCPKVTKFEIKKLESEYLARSNLS